MTYLVDANILSEPTKPAPHPKVVEWLRRNEAEIAVDAHHHPADLIIVAGLKST